MFDLRDVRKLMSTSKAGDTRFGYVSNTTARFPTRVSDLIRYADEEIRVKRRGVCIIENIFYDDIEALVAAWSVDLSFFMEHTSNRDLEDIWQKPDLHGSDIYNVDNDWRCLDGVHEFRNVNLENVKVAFQNNIERHIFEKHDFGKRSYLSTRISYYRVNEYLYLFLVDRPPSDILVPHEPNKPLFPELRFPYAENYRGVYWPGQRNGPSGWEVRHDVICAPFDVFFGRFRSSWQLQYLYATKKCFPEVALVYVILASLWESKLRFLRRQLRPISFDEIRRPNLKTTDKLHDLRQDMHITQKHVFDTKMYAPPMLAKYFAVASPSRGGTFSQQIDVPLDLHSPIQKLEEYLPSIEQYHTLLMETFNVLVSTLSVQESQAGVMQAQESLRQTRQSILLTRLAALYLPISAATGIYGMNLREINDASPRVWAFFPVLIGFFVLTWAAFYLGTYHGQQTESTKQQRPIQINDHVEKV